MNKIDQYIWNDCVNGIHHSVWTPTHTHFNTKFVLTKNQDDIRLEGRKIRAMFDLVLKTKIIESIDNEK